MIVLVLLFAVAISQMDELQTEKEKLAFIERNIVNIYRHTNIPEVFGANLNKMRECGCTHSASNIVWGSGVGMSCKLKERGYNEATCGVRCLSPRSENVLLMCPENWEADCRDGCVPPMFDSVRHRADFLEKNVDAIVKWGFDYLFVDQSYIDTCGCIDRLRHIRYGTQIGLDCIFNVDVWDRSKDSGCAGFGACTNKDGKPVMLFCPAGHSPTCSGCQKNLKPTADVDTRYDWMINLLTGWMRESQPLLDIVPSASKANACGCSSDLSSVTYGNGIGWSCSIDDDQRITAECGANVLCEDNSGKLLLHLCPSGFVPNCRDGCGYAWTAHEDL